MTTEITVDEGPPRHTPQARISESVLQCVVSQGKLERLVPKVIYGVVVGIPFVLGLVGGGEVNASLLLNTALWFLVARVLIWASRGAILGPSRRIRYEKAAANLRNFLHASDSLAVGPVSWTHGAPGALAISRAGEITVANLSTRYEILRILPHQVADVRVEREARHITHTRHSGGTTLGAYGKGFGVAQTFGGRSTSVTETIEQFFLEICYQPQKNGAVSTIVVPCGPVRHDAEELCLAIRRLEP